MNQKVVKMLKKCFKIQKASKIKKINKNYRFRKTFIEISIFYQLDIKNLNLN